MKKFTIVLILLSPLYVSAQVYNVLTYNSMGPINNVGLSIRTQIPVANDHMPTIHIKGSNYGNNGPIAIDIAWLMEGGNISATSASSSGGLTPFVYLCEDNNGMMVIYLQYDFFNPRFEITAFAEGFNEDPAWFTGWIVEDLPITNLLTEVPYFNTFRDNVHVNGTVSANQIYSSGPLWGYGITSYGNFLNNNYNNGTNGCYSAFADNNFTQNAYLLNSLWKSYGSKSLYGEAVLLQTAGKAGTAFNVLADVNNFTAGADLSFTNLFTIKTNGKAGIGSINPKELLQVNGNVTIVGNNKGYRFNSYFNSGDKYLSSGYGAAITLDQDGKLIFANTNISGTADAAATLNKVFVIDKNGNIGIGTSEPQGKLAINGTAYARKVKVTLDGWPDYVFDEKYQLLSLPNLEKYIKKHKHLPGVKSAAEIEKDGLDLGSSQAVLLEKIEELTLYIIDQNKVILKQKVASSDQQLRISNLEKKVEALMVRIKD